MDWPSILPGAFDAAALELEAPLGSGASSTVYRARLLADQYDLPAGTTVAVKLLRPELGDDAKATARMLAEGKLGARVHSPYVARIFGAVAGPPLYLVMELVRGKTLRQLIHETGAIAEDLARRIGQDAAHGLAALHELGIVHRDVKPENLALTPAGQVKIMDLGFAHRAGTRGLASSSGFFGSVGYAAPEMLRGNKASAAVDLYSLGVVLFELVTGRHPFAAAVDADDMLRHHLEQAPPRASHLAPRLSPFFELLLQQLLAKLPAQRLPRAADLAATLAQGEGSRWWRRHERAAPVLASRERLRALKRPAPTAFFGRLDESAVLDGALAAVVAGQGRAVKITGPRGIGRRRLLDESLERWLSQHQQLILLGGRAGHDAEQARGAPFPAMIADWFLAGDAPNSPQARTRLAARLHAQTDLSEHEASQLAALVSDGPFAGSPETRADLLARGLLALAQPPRMLVLRIENAEQMSSTGRQVVRRLLEALPARPLLLLLVTGTTATGLPRNLPELTVQGLAPTDFVAFGRALFDPGQDHEALLAAAHPVLGGSPGNLIEALDDLVQRGELQGRPGTYAALGNVTELRPPEPLLTRVRNRIAAMPPEQSFVVRAAAVLGDGAPVLDLVPLTGQAELEVLGALSAFQGRIVAAERGHLVFRHHDYRHAILDLMPTAARQRLHRTAAWLLEERRAPPLEIGLHFSRAGMHHEAIAPLLAGLERLTLGGSRRAALRVVERLRLHFEHVVDEGLPAQQRLRWCLLAGRTLHNVGQPARATRAWRQALVRARRLGAPLAHAEALTGLAEQAWQAARLRPAQRLAAWALAALGPNDDPAYRAVAALALSWATRIACDLGNANAAVRYVRQGLTMTTTGVPVLRAHLLLDLARTEALRAHFLAALKNLDRAAKLLARAPDALLALRLPIVRGSVLAQLGDDAAATAALETGLERALQLADRRAQARALLGLAEIAQRQGRQQAAVALSFDALAAASAAQDHVTKTLAALGLGQAGILVPGLQDDLAQLDAPVPLVLAALARAATAAAAGDTATQAAALATAAELEQRALLPLPLQIRVLSATGRNARARATVARVAARLPAGTMRRRFISLAETWV